jgi:hypothetical protein
MTLASTTRASLTSIGLATLISFLLNSAPHGEIVSAERLFWIGSSLLIYSTIIVVCYAVPVHLLLRVVGLTALKFYLAAGIIGPCIGYVMLYRLIEGSIWLGGLPVPLLYNALVGLLVAPAFHRLAYADKLPHRD